MKFIIFYLTVFAFLCKFSLGHVHNYQEKPETVQICEFEAQTQFNHENRVNFNCTNGQYHTLPSGKEICIDSPCTLDVSCSWQVKPGAEIILTPGAMNHLYPCSLCPTPNCLNKRGVTKDKKGCNVGEFKTSDYGETWQCESDLCMGTMKKDGEGNWYCDSPTCSGTGHMDATYNCYDKTCTEAQGGTLEKDVTKKVWKCRQPGCENSAGSMVKEDEGWVCVGSGCSGKMVKNGYDYNCVDPTCAGTMKKHAGGYWYCSSSNSTIYIVIGVLIAVVVAGVIYKKKKNQQAAAVANTQHSFGSGPITNDYYHPPPTK